MLVNCRCICWVAVDGEFECECDKYKVIDCYKDRFQWAGDVVDVCCGGWFVVVCLVDVYWFVGRLELWDCFVDVFVDLCLKFYV